MGEVPDSEGGVQILLFADEDADTSSPEQFAAMVKTDLMRLGKLVKDAGTEAE